MFTMFSKLAYWDFGANNLLWRFSHSGFPDRAPRSKVHETTKTWKLLSWNKNVHEILNNCCWGFVGRKWCLRCAPKLNLVMFEKKQCLRDAPIWASGLWNRPNVYKILGTCMLVSFGTKIMYAGGVLKTWNSGFWDKFMFTRFLNLGFVGLGATGMFSNCFKYAFL